MGRKLAGTLVILAALLAALMCSRFIRAAPSRTAERQPKPAVPVAGNCAVHDHSGLLQFVSCDQPHDAEIAAAWAAGQTAQELREGMQRCEDAGRRYLGIKQGWDVPAVSDSGWSLAQIRFVVQDYFGPSNRLIRGWSWQACVVIPLLPDGFRSGYTGRLSDFPSSGGVSIALRSCYTRAKTTTSKVSCMTRHQGEVLADRLIEIASSEVGDTDRDVDPVRIAECETIASRLTGHVDPTDGGRLTIIINLRLISATMRPAIGSPQPGRRRAISTYDAACALEVTGKSALVGSVIGLGDKPVPLR